MVHYDGILCWRKVCMQDRQQHMQQSCSSGSAQVAGNAAKPLHHMLRMDASDVAWQRCVCSVLVFFPCRTGGSATNHLVVLKNKEPKWNTALNAYCLNFNGRVTEASVKNFQLVTTNDPDTVVLQFGKISDTCFTCDFSWPLSPVQAFSICLSSFDNKLACE
jgi:hypothetical protein